MSTKRGAGATTDSSSVNNNEDDDDNFYGIKLAIQTKEANKHKKKSPKEHEAQRAKRAEMPAGEK